MSDVYCQKQFQVGEYGEPALTVREWPDIPGYVDLSALGDEAQLYFGAFEIPMKPAFARALARALIEIADHVEGK